MKKKVTEYEMFKKFLRTGGRFEGSGGYLIPEYLSIPAKGVKAFLWRLLAKIYFAIGWYGSYYVAHEKGCYRISRMEYLNQKVFTRNLND